MSLETFHQLIERQSQPEGLRVKKTDQLTLGEILGLYQSGVPVVRTPHVGNFSDGNLTVLGIGLPAVILDNNQLDKDTIYHPASMSQGGQEIHLSKPVVGQLSKFAQIQKGVRAGDSLVDFHIGALKNAFRRNHQLQTLSEFFRGTNAQLVETVVMIILQTYPELFKRKLVDGVSQPLSPTMITLEVAHKGIFPINGSDCGILIPNEVAIILDLILELHGSEESVLIELTGKTMSEYVTDSYGEKLAQIYATIRKRLGSSFRLQPSPTLLLVPTASARATVALAQVRAMREVFDAYLALSEGSKLINQFKGVYIGTSGDEKAAISALATPSKIVANRASERLQQAVKCLPQIFSPVWYHRVSQHDLADGYYFDSRVLSLTQKELAIMMKTCDQLYLQP